MSEGLQAACWVFLLGMGIVGVLLLALWDYGRRNMPPEVHVGRIWFDVDKNCWRYACHDCDYGAGSVADGAVAWEWLMQLAGAHAEPNHWTRK